MLFLRHKKPWQLLEAFALLQTLTHHFKSPVPYWKDKVKGHLERQKALQGEASRQPICLWNVATGMTTRKYKV